MEYKREKENNSIPEKWSPRGKTIGFYLDLFSDNGSFHLLMDYRFEDLQTVYARLGPQRIRRWRKVGIEPGLIIYCFSDPLSLSQFNDCRKALDTLVRANFVQISRNIGFIPAVTAWKIISPASLCSYTLVDFYLRYVSKDYPINRVISWCFHEMYASGVMKRSGLSPGPGRYRYPHTQIAGWMRSGFTHKQVNALMRVGFCFERPEKAISAWRRHKKQGYTFEEFCDSHSLIGGFQGNRI